MIWVGMSRLAKYWHQMAEAKTSMPASLSGLPCSAVSTGARSAVEAISTSAACRRVAPPGRLVRLPVAGRLGGGVEGGVELLARALGRLGEDLAGGGVAHAERVLRRSGLPGNGHDEIGHGTPRLLVREAAPTAGSTPILPPAPPRLNRGRPGRPTATDRR